MTVEGEVASDQRPLGQVVSRALGWSTTAQVVNRVGTFATGIILARHLTPSDFGIFAVILVVINVVMTVNDIGVIAAVIRWQGDVETAASTARTVVFLFSLVFYAVMFIAAPTFARALSVPEATSMLRVVALVVVIDGAAGVSQAMLVRSFDQAKLLVAGATGTAVYLVAAIVLATAGAGPWSIVWARLGSTAIAGALIVGFAPVRGGIRFDRAIASELVRFGIPQAGVAVLTEGLLNVDYLIVGRVLGVAPLGLYLLAFNLSSWPTSIVGLAVGPVAFAGLARLVEDRKRLAIAFPRAFGMVVATVLPIVLLLLVLGPEVIRAVYGEKWLPAVTALRYLLVLGGLRIMVELLANLVSADGRPKVNLAIRVVWLLALVPTLFVGAHLAGIRGVGIGHMIVVVGLVFPLLLSAVRRSGIRSVALWHNSWRALAAAAVAVAVMLALRPLVHDVARIALIGSAGLVAYGLTLVPGNPLVGWAKQQLWPRSAVAAGTATADPGGAERTDGRD